MAAQRRLLFVSTPVGPLGSGLGGGVELTLLNVCRQLRRQGHAVDVLAPIESNLPGLSIRSVAGALQPTAHTQSRDASVTLPLDGVLANMWSEAHNIQVNYDLIVNFAYDWLPFYLTSFFKAPIAHFVSMGSLTDAMDLVISRVAKQFPGTIGVYTKAQANTFSFAMACQVLGSAVDLSCYQFCDRPDDHLAWLGRISPEKGLEDAVAAAEMANKPLKVLGKLENQNYWQSIQNRYPKAPVEYLGFLATQDLQGVLRRCRALLMTPRWVEAFGNVAIEALACGVPVIAYARGGPTEIIRSEETGWLVEPDSISGLVRAIQRIDQLSRRACRRQAEQEYSLEALGGRFEAWFEHILSLTRR